MRRRVQAVADLTKWIISLLGNDASAIWLNFTDYIWPSPHLPLVESAQLIRHVKSRFDTLWWSQTVIWYRATRVCLLQAKSANRWAFHGRSFVQRGNVRTNAQYDLVLRQPYVGAPVTDVITPWPISGHFFDPKLVRRFLIAGPPGRIVVVGCEVPCEVWFH